MTRHFVDMAVIGSGPAGREAALTASAAGKRALIIERDREAGGSCVRFGTIPSKTLRETALVLDSLERRTGGMFTATATEDMKLAALMTRLRDVHEGHERAIRAQLAAGDVDLWQGRARFCGPHELEVLDVRGGRRLVEARAIVIATGSRPRTPPMVPVDHEHILDSDSILSLGHLPTSLIVLGGGVIASEYASVFASLGVAVTMIDRAPSPLGFLDPELTQGFLRSLRSAGAQYLGERQTTQVSVTANGSVVVTLADGTVHEAEKVLCALGRVANVEGLDLDLAGVSVSPRGHIVVGPECQTEVPFIYAVGDVAGPPSLAASGAEQGRRAAHHALGVSELRENDMVPTGVYTLPEIACVGPTEAEARARYGHVLVGRAPFEQTARGLISCAEDGLLKMIAAPDGQRILGVAAVGEGASELVCVGQVAIIAGFSVDQFVQTIFNFPTLVEAYRIAAMDIRRQHERERERSLPRRQRSEASTMRPMR